MNLGWTNNSATQTAVTVERSSDDVTFVQIATLSGTTTSYQDQGLFPGNSYYYRVRAWNGPTPSAYSATASNILKLPAWTQIAAGAPVPTGRVNMGFANATISSQMVIAAGDDSSFPATNNQTWTFKYSGTGSPAWAQQGTGTNPGVRSWPGTAYDSGNQRVILIGGLDQSNPSSPIYRNDVWSLTQSSPGVWGWAPVTVTGTPPPGLFGHTVVMSGAKAYVLGGQNANPVNNLMSDLWVLDFSSVPPTWSHVSAGPLDARVFHVAILDTANQRMVVFGGFDGVNYRNDTWALNLAGAPNWSPIVPAGTLPFGRSNTSAVYHTGAQMMIVFGGNSVPGSSNDVWMLSLSGNSAWQQVLSTGSPPGTRGGHAAIFDDATGRMLLFGGQDFMLGTLYPDTWKLQF
jgi:hypothetical protein